MKKVFGSSNDVIHLFAQRTQEEARNGSCNVFFEYCTKLYSYGHHYLLAEFVNEEAILINDSGYSVTTSKHISQVIGATRHYKQFFKKKVDLSMVYQSVILNKTKLARARKPEMYINTILSLWESLNEFIDYTKDKLIKKRSEYKEIKRIVKALIERCDDFRQKLKEAAIKEARALKKRTAKQLKESLAKFNSYKINFFRIGDEDFLRLSQDGEMVETSQGVKVSTKSAKLLYNLILRGIDIKGHQIEYYKVTSINGTLTIGCHNINIASMHSIGKQL